jgi:parallel beta-helix repeat protein
VKLLITLTLALLIFHACDNKQPIQPSASPSPSPIATARPTPNLSPTPRPVPLPYLPSTTVRVRDFPGSDLGAQINAASASIAGPARLITPPGTIATQVRLRKGHVLKLERGRYVVAIKEMDMSAIVLDDGCGIVGAGIGESVLVESPTGYIVIQSVGSGQTIDGYFAAGITSNLLLHGFTIEGANTRPEGGVRGSISLGNAHHVRISSVELRNTSCLGITAGGTALGPGNHAEDWIVEHCIFRGVASQALNVVNGRQVIFRYNRFLDSGKFPSMGMTPIDVEPNTPQDWAREIEIYGNLVDSTNSTFAHGNGILVQNGAQTAGFGPVVVKNNIVIGGALVQPSNSRIYTGIYINGERVTVTNNSVQRTSHAGIRLEGSRNVMVSENQVVSTGTGGINALEVIGTTDSVIQGNTVSVSPLSPLGSGLIVESGGSDRNTFSGNSAAGVVIVGGRSIVTESGRVKH